MYKNKNMVTEGNSSNKLLLALKSLALPDIIQISPKAFQYDIYREHTIQFQYSSTIRDFISQYCISLDNIFSKKNVHMVFLYLAVYKAA